MECLSAETNHDFPPAKLQYTVTEKYLFIVA